MIMALLVGLEVLSAGALVGVVLHARGVRADVDKLRAEVALARIEGVLGPGDLDPQVSIPRPARP